MSLDEHRNQIDAIDSQMVKLLNERLQHALAIGKIKLEQGGSIYAPHREKAVFDRVCALNEGPLPDDSLRAIYREIMSAAISLEKPISNSLPVLINSMRMVGIIPRNTPPRNDLSIL